MFKRRPLKEWVREPGTQTGLTTLAVLVGGYFGLPAEVSTGILGLIASIAVIRRG